ncbi:MAG: NAD(P)H-dependent oxidoreductase [Pseudomonadales bacterium]|nr:NAD(P)H-dependent oxidoreductase [Pseudomonadales bacterium]
MKILTFAASSSQNSINKKLLQFAAKQLQDAEIEYLDINDYEMPIFSEDREKELGQPEAAQRFFKKMGEADALIISFAEHNGSYTAAFKNLFDWTSRIDMKLYQNKPIVMLATSPGPGGARNVLNTAVTSAPYFAGNVVGQLSIAKFYDVFDMETGVINDAGIIEQLSEALSALQGIEEKAEA